MDWTSRTAKKLMAASIPLCACMLFLLMAAATAQAPPPRQTRLILKDGSYQIVLSYQIKKAAGGDRVIYKSAERGGMEEELPANLVDWDATHKWERDHAAGAAMQTEAPPTIDPELLKEEQAERERMPDVAPHLHLPERGSVYVLDTFQGTPELVALQQSNGNLDRNTAHNVLKAAINPAAVSHQLVQLRGTSAEVQLHVAEPEIYVRIGDDDSKQDAPPDSFKVDTHGASGMAGSSSGGSPDSMYVMVRADVRKDVRIIASVRVNMMGQVIEQEDVVAAMAQMLPGGHWLKLTPSKPLDFGEYALMEVLSKKEVNLEVWDFGVHPQAPENDGAILPQQKKPVVLQPRPEGPAPK